MGVSKRGADTINHASGESCLDNDVPECSHSCNATGVPNEITCFPEFDDFFNEEAHSADPRGEELTVSDLHPVVVEGNSPWETSENESRFERLREKRRRIDNDEHRRLKRRKDFVPIVHAGVLSKALHKDGEVRPIIENLGDNSGYTAEDAPT